ncbi:MAG: anhydro-N-acetylmuramic acid kinase [Candidatus Acidiferrales bacterium]
MANLRDATLGGTSKSLLVLGLMSGTSADGIDVALVRIARRPQAERGIHARLLDFHSFPFRATVRAEILRVANGGTADTAGISNLNFLLGELFARAALDACARFRVNPRRIALIGSHGQTIYHQGQRRPFLGARHIASTLQIGEPAIIAERTGITTIGDFRTADMAAGGEGAPLVPFVDYLLYRDPLRPRVALNIGGIANLSVIRAAARPADVIAFDTGPGNMIIDALVRHFTRDRRTFDRNASIATRGVLLPQLLMQLLAHRYFHQPPPKTCGREQFGDASAREIIHWGRKNKVRPESLIRTATLLTPLSIIAAFHRWVFPALRRGRGGTIPGACDLILAGGGAHNPLIRAQLEAGLAAHGVRILTSADLGVPEDGKEALAFAILACETWHRRPSNLPSATGARHSAILGKICYAPR